MRIAICWDWGNELEQLITWKDGFAAMFRELGRKADIQVFTQLKRTNERLVVTHEYFPINCSPTYMDMEEWVIDWKPDFVLFWADMTRPAIPNLTHMFPSGILFSGGEPITENTHRFDVIFTESESYLARFRERGLNAHQAFGTNTEHFKPIEKPKLYDAFFPATFASWKRHNLFAEATKGLRAYACGWKQQTDTECFEVCERNNVFTTGHLPGNLLPDFYNASSTVVVTSASNGGSQRTVLEAMSCNVPVIVMSDSEKTSEYLRKARYPHLICEPNPEAIRKKIAEWTGRTPQTRNWVVENMSEFTWANKVYEEIDKVLSYETPQN